MYLLSHFNLSFPRAALVLTLSKGKVAANGAKMLVCTISPTKLFGEVLCFVGNEGRYETVKLCKADT